MALLLVERGPQKGKSVRVEQGRVVRVGRAGDCDLVLNDPLVSRHHFEVEGRNGAFYIRDPGSTNGTYLNGEKVSGERELQVGDRIEVGDCLLTFIPHERWQKQDTVTGQTVAGYLITERVGRGGMGTVYKALQLSLDRTVALKILSQELCKDTKFVEMFVREARSAGQLNHPNIVHVYDVGKWRDIYYLSMEFMAGGSVADLIGKEKRLRARHVIAMAIDAARGLEYAEQRGIVHRDIKPANLMLTEEGVVKIGDLGIARRVPPGGAIKEERLWGSPLYMAPEQARCDRIDHRADIYALGATMYHMLSGHPPFSGKTLSEIIHKQIREKPKPLKEVAPGVPEPLCNIVDKMLEKEPDRRFGSASEVVGALEELKRRVRVARPSPTHKQVHRRVLLVVGGVVAALVVTVLVAFLLSAMIRAQKRRMEKRRKEFVSAVEDVQDEWDAGLAARNSTPAARIKALRARYQAVAKSLKELLGKFADVPNAKKQVEKIKQAVRRRLSEEVRRFEEEGLARLRDAQRFWESHKRSFDEAERLFREVMREYAGSEAAKVAKGMVEAVLRARKAHKKRLEEAESCADGLIKEARKCTKKGKFRKARTVLAMFPKEYGDTPAMARIRAEMASLVLKEREALDALKWSVLRLLRSGRLEEAGRIIGERESDFGLREAARVFALLRSRLEEARKARKERERQRLLRRDSETLAGVWEEARSLCAGFRADDAIDALRRVELRIETPQYRRLARIAALIVATWRDHHKALIDAINNLSLRKSVRLKIGRSEGPVVAADEQKVFISLRDTPQSAQTFCKWHSLSIRDLRRLYEAMGSGAQIELGKAAFLILRGLESDAERKLNSIKDPALASTVNRFKEFVRWLK
ncbi:MAG: hypothetical protein DRP63_05385 [Planctomycetota bacterium]|nr:MAG: hypothetical protein DRP63_05385 [Planctomycetota bacterium]